MNAFEMIGTAAEGIASVAWQWFKSLRWMYKAWVLVLVFVAFGFMVPKDPQREAAAQQHYAAKAARMTVLGSAAADVVRERGYRCDGVSDFLAYHDGISWRLRCGPYVYQLHDAGGHLRVQVE